MKHLLAAALLAFSACTLPHRSAENLDEVPDGQVVLVGRLSFSRKLPPSSHVVNVMDAINSGLLRASAGPLPFLESRPSSFEKDDILVRLDDIFSVPFDRYPQVFVSGIYSFRYDEKGRETYAFPVMGSFRVPAKARFLYLGHITLKLDDFYTLKGVKVTDEFDKDSKLFARFPGIRKSLFVAN